MDFAKASERLTALRESLEGGTQRLVEKTSDGLSRTLGGLMIAKDNLGVIKGSFYYRLHGQGSVNDWTTRNSGAYFTPQERRKVQALEHELEAFEKKIDDLVADGRALKQKIKGVDKLMGLG